MLGTLIALEYASDRLLNDEQGILQLKNPPPYSEATDPTEKVHLRLYGQHAPYEFSQSLTD